MTQDVECFVTCLELEVVVTLPHPSIQDVQHGEAALAEFERVRFEIAVLAGECVYSEQHDAEQRKESFFGQQQRGIVPRAGDGLAASGSVMNNAPTG